jgi:4-amino-4-deoxy-L-arabinose transferase-like glycosyltransferase
MPNCPKCGALLDEDAAFCSKCGSALPQQLTASSSMRERELRRLEIARKSQSTSPPSAPSYPPARDMTRTHATLGYISALLSLFIVPEVFGPVAIILGAYTWKREQGNRGITILILGIIFMLVGLYFTAYFTLGDLLPS